MHKLIELALNFVYPRCCPVCHGVLRGQDRLLCPSCAGKIRPVEGARCFRCGKPVKPEQEYCRECSGRTRSFDQGMGIFFYDEIWRRSMVRYKYYGCREYGDFYARAMFLYGKEALKRWKPDVMVPVPLHPQKQRTRGFNQAEYLAEGLKKFTGIPVDTSLLQKIKNTKSQKKLSASMRRKNLQEAFRASPRAAGKRILLIDDVYTTGSTMDAAAACLKGCGAKRVYFMTVCTGRDNV